MTENNNSILGLILNYTIEFVAAALISIQFLESVSVGVKILAGLAGFFLLKLRIEDVLEKRKEKKKENNDSNQTP